MRSAAVGGRVGQLGQGERHRHADRHGHPRHQRRCLLGVGTRPRPAGPVQPDGAVHRRQEDDRHQHRVVVPGGAPVRGVGGGEAPAEGRHRHQHQRRAQAEQAGDAEDPAQGAPLDRRPDQPEQHRADVGVRGAAAGEVAEVGVVVVGGEEGDEPVDRHRDRRDAAGQQQCPRLPPAVQQEQQAQGGHGQPHVLLDQQQRQRPPGRPGPALQHQLAHHHGHDRDAEGDLVEVRVDRPLQAPGQPVGRADGQPLGAGQQQLGGGGDDGDRGGEQHGLGHQQGDRRREQPVERGEGGDDRGEVVPEHVEAGALDVGDRRPEVRVAAHRLGEDRQVPLLRAEPLVAGDRQHGPDRAEDGAEEQVRRQRPAALTQPLQARWDAGGGRPRLGDLRRRAHGRHRSRYAVGQSKIPVGRGCRYGTCESPRRVFPPFPIALEIYRCAEPTQDRGRAAGWRVVRMGKSCA